MLEKKSQIMCQFIVTSSTVDYVIIYSALYRTLFKGDKKSGLLCAKPALGSPSLKNNLQAAVLTLS